MLNQILRTFNEVTKLKILMFRASKQALLISIDDTSFLKPGFTTERDFCSVQFWTPKPIQDKNTVLFCSVIHKTEREI